MQLATTVSKIIADVQQNGDTAALKYTRQFDYSNIKKLAISRWQLRQAYKKATPQLISALKQAAENITKTQTAYVPKNVQVSPARGISITRKFIPIDTIGIYVPGGLAAYPSSVLMAAIPARLANVKNIILCSPPSKSGQVSPAVLAACYLCNIKNVYAIGGAQAIAAMAYGTQTVPKVNKIVGPGSAVVTEAKRQIFGQVNIDVLAGPSEVVVLADETTNLDWAIADLSADAEHSPDTKAVLVTTYNKLVKLPPNLRQVRCRNLKQAIKYINGAAPEHVLVQTTNATSISVQITQAGTVYVGPYTSKSSGDYATGANHILPTGGLAKSFSGVSINTFGRWVEYQTVTKSGLSSIRQTIKTLAKTEGLPAHVISTNIRFSKDHEKD
ncbi:MAG: histidinol dehydrogenase [Microgenomates group bacterium Gr01-1014_16]|nr:MAG: histidinol dehydrogenase [Microgenomates group bacterium Gr01-1014_16]